MSPLPGIRQRVGIIILRRSTLPQRLQFALPGIQLLLLLLAALRFRRFLQFLDLLFQFPDCLLTIVVRLNDFIRHKGKIHGRPCC